MSEFVGGFVGEPGELKHESSALGERLAAALSWGLVGKFLLTPTLLDGRIPRIIRRTIRPNQLIPLADDGGQFGDIVQVGFRTPIILRVHSQFRPC